jgi:hypothetical protein
VTDAAEPTGSVAATDPAPASAETTSDAAPASAEVSSDVAPPESEQVALADSSSGQTSSAAAAAIDEPSSSAPLSIYIVGAGVVLALLVLFALTFSVLRPR